MGAVHNEGAVALGIQRAAFARTILGVLRRASEPISARQIAEIEQSGRDMDARSARMVMDRVRNAMPRLSDKLDGELRGRTTYWSIKKTSTG